MSVSIEADWLDDWDDVLSDQMIEEFSVDPVDFAASLVIDPLEHSDWGRTDGIGYRAFQAGLRERFEDLVRSSGRRSDREV